MSDAWNLFWIFIIFASLMPVLQQKMMQAKRLGLMKKLENKRKSRVIDFGKERGDTTMTCFWVGHHEDEHKVSFRSRGDPGFSAVEDVLGPIEHGT